MRKKYLLRILILILLVKGYVGYNVIDFGELITTCLVTMIEDIRIPKEKKKGKGKKRK